MPDFTDDQIREARENPRPGDVWAFNDYQIFVGDVSTTEILGSVLHIEGRVINIDPCVSFMPSRFAARCANATLLRRGA